MLDLKLKPFTLWGGNHELLLSLMNIRFVVTNQSAHCFLTLHFSFPGNDKHIRAWIQHAIMFIWSYFKTLWMNNKWRCGRRFQPWGLFTVVWSCQLQKISSWGAGWFPGNHNESESQIPQRNILKFRSWIITGVFGFAGNSDGGLKAGFTFALASNFSVRNQYASRTKTRFAFQ